MNPSPVRSRWPRAAMLLPIVLGSLATLCGPLPLKDPLSVPLDPVGQSPYRKNGRRIAYNSAVFSLMTEPLDSPAVRAFFKEHADVDMDPFSVAGGRSMQVFRVTVLNKGKEDLAFNAVYALMDAEGRYLYHMSMAEAARAIGPMFPDADIEKLLGRTLFDATTTVNPGHYVSRLMVFEPLPEDVRTFTLAFNNLGVGDAMTDVMFPFRVVERAQFEGPKPPVPADPSPVPAGETATPQ